MIDKELLAKLSPEELAELHKMLAQYEEAQSREEAQDKFLPFVKHMWPKFLEGEHHRIIANAFERIARGENRFVVINVPPRHGKSELASKYFPAWYMGRNPDQKIIMSSHTASLAVDFGRAVKNIVGTPQYREVFPEVSLKADSKAAGRWGTNHGGEYYAIGTGGAIAGRGANLYVIDDPHSEQDAINAINNPDVWSRVWDWYTGGPVQRLQPGGAICLVMCVAKGERILCANGEWKSIEQIEPGENVISYHNGKQASGRVIHKKSNGLDDVFKVKSRSCELRVNGRHPFLVVRKTGPSYTEWTVEWVRCRDLMPGDMAVTIKSITNALYSGQAKAIPNFLDSGKSSQISLSDVWLLGYLWGDGWIESDRGRIRGVSVALSDKPAFDEAVQIGLENLSGLKAKGYKNGGALRLRNKKFAEWMQSIGFTSGASCKRLPAWIYRTRNSFKRAFLRGFFSADGWLRPSKYAETWTACLNNRDLLDDLRLLARTCGVRCSKIYEYTRKQTPPKSSKAVVFKQYSCRFSFKEKVTENKNFIRHTGSMGRAFRLERIESISPDGKEEVWDIEVEGTGNFVAEGFVVHNTRWSKLDLTGMILEDARKKGRLDEWEVIEIPAQLPSGSYLWEDFWPREDYERIKDSIPKSKWLAQYQQQPTSEEGAIIKREYWRRWKRASPPHCTFVLISWDTAFDKTARSDYSACTVWGMFHPDEDTDRPPNIMLLDAFRDKLEFPELKKRAYNHFMEVQPDSIIIEKKAAGSPLIYELRAAGIPVTEYVPSRGNDKLVRANAVSDLFSSGVVWAPEERWADEVIEECAEFPNGAHDDFVDSTTQALIRLRQGGLVTIDSDDFKPTDYEPYKAAYYKVGES